MDEHEPPGKVRPVLELADAHLQQQQEEERCRALGVERPRARASERCRRRTTRKRTPKIAVARTCTYSAACRRQSRSTSALPGCGPAAVETMPLTTSASSAAAATNAPRRSVRGSRSSRAAALERVRLDGDDDARREHRQREEEVRHHEPRVQPRVDGERAERRLRERPEERREREPSHPARQPGREARAEPRDERGEDRERAHDAVAELDERVVALARQRVAGGAAGPVLAAEAGVRQADGRAAR